MRIYPSTHSLLLARASKDRYEQTGCVRLPVARGQGPGAASAAHLADTPSPFPPRVSRASAPSDQHLRRGRTPDDDHRRWSWQTRDQEAPSKAMLHLTAATCIARSRLIIARPRPRPSRPVRAVPAGARRWHRPPPPTPGPTACTRPAPEPLVVASVCPRGPTPFNPRMVYPPIDQSLALVG